MKEKDKIQDLFCNFDKKHNQGVKYEEDFLRSFWTKNIKNILFSENTTIWRRIFLTTMIEFVV